MGELINRLKSFFRQEDYGLRNNWWETYSRADSCSRESTPPLLHMACYFGIAPWVQALLPKHRVPWFHHKRTGKKDNDGWTALHWAAEEGHEAVTRLLVNRGAEVNAEGNYGDMALHWAAVRGHEGVVRLLVERGANVNAKVSDGWTALHWAAKGGHEGVVRPLELAGAS
jgi:hypothetical protein